MGNKPQLYFECPLHQQPGTLGEEYSPVTRVVLVGDLRKKAGHLINRCSANQRKPAMTDRRELWGQSEGEGILETSVVEPMDWRLVLPVYIYEQHRQAGFPKYNQCSKVLNSQMAEYFLARSLPCLYFLQNVSLSIKREQVSCVGGHIFALRRRVTCFSSQTKASKKSRNLSTGAPPAKSVFQSSMPVCSVVSDSLWPHGSVAHQTSLRMGFPRQEYWGVLPFPPPVNLPRFSEKVPSLPLNNNKSQSKYKVRPSTQDWQFFFNLKYLQ